MRRGEVYLIKQPTKNDPKKRRAFVVVSRQKLIDTRFSTVICAPIYSQHDGLATQVSIGVAEGLKHDSSIHCDELLSIPRAKLTNYLGKLSATKIAELSEALKVALELED
jgi:mRNA interferase MazF